MKAKLFSLMTLSILMLVLLVGLTSAALLAIPPTSIVKPTSVEHYEGSFTFTFNLTNSEFDSALDWSASTVSGGNAKISFNQVTIANGSAIPVTIPVTATVTFDESYFGILSGEVSVIGQIGETPATLPFSVSILAPSELSECSSNPGKLDIKSIEFTNNGLGEEDDEWVPLDEIEVEIEIENDGDYDVDDIVLEWGLYDTKNKLWIIELDEEDEFNLKEGDEEVFLVSFKIDDDLEVGLEDLKDGDNYRFYVIATGDVDDDNTNPKTCVFSSEPASISIDSDFLILGNFQIEGIALEDGEYPGALSCGSTLQLTADLWNIGDSEQEDIKVRIYNSYLGIDETLEIGDVNSFDSESISFEFTIPEGMEEKWYELEFIIQEDGDVFENDYVEEDAEFKILFKLENCAFAQALVSASLDSGGKAGKELVVRATITNTGSESTSYLINAAGYAEWASSATVEPSTIVLGAGQSADVLITLDVSRDASGERLFNIEVLSEGQLVVNQPLSVSIEKALVGNLLGDNLATALVIGIALILVVIIIVLAIRVARK